MNEIRTSITPKIVAILAENDLLLDEKGTVVDFLLLHKHHKAAHEINRMTSDEFEEFIMNVVT